MQRRTNNSIPVYSLEELNYFQSTSFMSLKSLFRRARNILLGSLFLYACALHLFTSGFLLTRFELDVYNTCDSLGLNSSNNCSPRFNKTILIIIDALRFDFTDYQESYPEPIPHYINKLPIINSVLKNTSLGSNGHGLLFRARADPPTTTTQRLKAIVTGNLPTFVDAGSNFASFRINEDNLIRQFLNKGKNTVFMGDDTWEGLFPETFNTSYPFPSFDCWDLHTVENGIIHNLFPHLENPNWDLLVAHFLGVDHAGHRYGPEHPAMEEKLTQMNDVLTRVFNAIDNDTIVYVMGDHGMDPKGDHGGESENEVNAGLFIYSKQNLFQMDSNWNDLMMRLTDADFKTDEPLVSLHGQRTFPQIDIVPTIALLAGLPIPFGNLGTIIPELFYNPNSKSGLDSLNNLVDVARLNSHQIYTYIQEYSLHRPWPIESMSLLSAQFEIAESLFKSNLDPISKYLEYTKFNRHALTSARDIWTRYDVHLIFMGVSLMIILSISLLIYLLVEKNAKHSIYSYLLAISTGLVFAFNGVAETIFGALDEHSVLTKYQQCLFFIVILPFITFIMNNAAGAITMFQFQKVNEFSKSWILGIVLFIMYTVGPASDSFTIYEDSITLYLLQTFGLITFFQGLSSSDDHNQKSLQILSLLFMVVSRISGYPTICREEQVPFCTPTFNFLPNSSISGPYSVVLLWIVTFTNYLLFKNYVSNRNHSLKIILRFINFGFLLSNIYWTLDTIEQHHFLNHVLWMVPIIKKIIAVFGLTTILSSCIILGIYNAYTLTLKYPINEEHNSLEGFYYTFIYFTLLVLSILQKPMGGAMLGFAFMQIGILLQMFKIMHKTKYSHQKSNRAVLFLFVMVFYLIGQRYYFSTGHQRKLAGIQYEIGFIGIDKVNWILSPIMILFNTYGAQTLATLSIPLLTAWKIPLNQESECNSLYDSMDAMKMHLLIISWKITSVIIFAGLFRRHVMTWRVFAPNFIFCSVETLIELVMMMASTAIPKEGLLNRKSKGQKQPERSETIQINLSPTFSLSSSFFKLIFLNILLLVLYSSGLFLFSSGFLLTRLELDSTNNCQTSQSDCQHPPRFNKTILIIIDALRFDFTDYQESYPEPIPHYINKLPIINSVLKNTSLGSNGHGLLFRARADPPTTTLQRLKAITTGNLPTFVDAGSNFASTKINEDNLILQFNTQRKNAVFMGDDTWMGLYPTSFNNSYPFPSFDVWDLHSVDNGVVENLYPHLENPNWDLLVAHFLGVDHAGHRYGPEHPAMAKKLTQMNSILERVFSMVSDDTIVYVMGDHGMDPKGDHGGDSENELNAGLFIYSKKPLTLCDETWKLLVKRLNATDFHTDEPVVFLDGHRTFPQIDIVPTIALLSGLSIPFGNLGSIIPELFFTSSSLNATEAIINLIKVSKLNSNQINNYIKEYTSRRSWAAESLSALSMLFDEAEASFSKSMNSTSLDDLIDVYIKYTTYSRRALISARKIWARFDVALIIMGITILITVILAFAIYCLIEEPSSKFIIIYFFVNLLAVLLGSLGIIQRFFVEAKEDTALTNLHEILFFAITGSLITFLILSARQIFKVPKDVISSKNIKNISAPWILGILLALMYIALPASDSFTIYEDFITGYLMQTFGLYNLIQAFSIKEPAHRDSVIGYSFLFMIITRISSYSTICREEQHPFCTPTFNHLPNSSIAGPFSVLLLIFTTLAVLLTSKKLLKSGDNLTGTSNVLAGYVIPIGMIVSISYWILDTCEGHHISVGLIENLIGFKSWIARFGFITVSLTCIFVWITDSLSVSLEIENSDSNLIIPDGPKSLIIKGIANAIGAAYYTFVLCILMIINMIQKPMGAAMLGFGFIQMSILLEMFHVIRDKATFKDWKDWKQISGLKKKQMAKTPEDVDAMPIPAMIPVDSGLLFLYCVIFFIMSQRYFFATGHQRALSSIQYEIGFIGIEKVNWIMSPLMILFNTFGSQILFAFSIPLLVVWKRPYLSGMERRFEKELDTVIKTYLGIILISITSGTLFAGHFRRHLMVWRVFAPKFIFSTVETLLGLVICGIVTGLLMLCTRQFNLFLQRLSKYAN